MSDLKKEYEFFLKNQDDFVKKYKGKIIVIKDCKVIGEYESEIDAVEETTKEYDLGTFLVQKCDPEKDRHVQTFHSRVVFS